MMDHHSVRKSRHVDPGQSMTGCPECGYGDGFHVSLQARDSAGLSRIILICPSCHSRFDPGWTVGLMDAEPAP